MKRGFSRTLARRSDGVRCYWKDHLLQVSGLLKPTGVHCANGLGAGWSNTLLSIVYDPTGRGRVRIPLPEDTTRFIRHLAGLMAQGLFGGVIDRGFPLEETVIAFQYVETGQETGIVRIDVC